MIVGSAVIPVHIVITILLVRAPGGRAAAAAWVGGMTVLRLAQGVVFGLVLDAGPAGDAEQDGVIVAVLQLVLAVVFYLVAARKLLKVPDEDAPPPRWMTMLDGITAPKAFALGFGVLAIGAKFWVFTLGAIAAIGEADLGLATSIWVFLLFVVLAQAVHLGIVGFAFVAPGRSDAVLGRFADLLTRYTRPLLIVLGLVFGTWFLLGALEGLGIM